MPINFRRSVHTAIGLLLALPASSALGAPSAAHAVAGAEQGSGHHRGTHPGLKHKPGAVVHRGRSQSVAGATAVLAGDTAVEWQYDSLAAGDAEAFLLKADTSGLADAVHVYVGANNASATLIAGLYSSQAGQPGTLLSAGSTSAPRSGTWSTVSIAPVELVLGRSYWLAILGEGGRLRYRDRAQGPCPSETSARSDLRALPRSWRTGTTYADCPASAYVTAAAPAPAPTGSSPLASGLPEEGPALAESEAAPQAPAAAPLATAPPMISGEAAEGQLLLASSGDWTGSPSSYAYQWEDCDASGESCSSIPGATSSSYELAASDVGHALRVVVTASDAGGSTEASSAATATVTAAAPTSLAPPTISGPAVEGQTLSAGNGEWTGSPTSYAYHWQRCNASGGSCSNITGATSASYELSSSEVGHTVRVLVSASNSIGSTKAASAVTAAVVAAGSPAPPTNTALPRVSGTAVEGQTLSATTGSWTESPTSYGYQWRDCDSAGGSCSNIATATSSTYKLGSADVGHTVRVVVTATNASGSTPATSEQTAPVSAPGSERTFYINYETTGEAPGSESHSEAEAQTEAHPWQRAPGMQGFTAGYSHEPGDRFVFRGGVSWPRSVFPLAPPEGASGSGMAGDDDYYGVSRSWYRGGRFEAPVFDAEGKEITAGDEHTGGRPANIFMDFSQDDYVTVEGIKFAGWAVTTPERPYGTCAVVNIGNGGDEREYERDYHVTINEITVVDFAFTNEALSEDPRCAVVEGRPGVPYNGESVVENSTIEPSGPSFGTGVWNVGNVVGNTIKNMLGMVYPDGHGVIAGNHLEGCGYPTVPAGANSVHANAIEVEGNDGKPFYIYDNVIRGTGAKEGVECESTFLGTGTEYYFDNVVADVEGNPLDLETAGNAAGKDYIFNNTYEGGGLGGEFCIRAGHGGEMAEIVIKNNLCIGRHTGPGEIALREGSDGIAAKTITEEHNLLLSPSQVASAGYTTMKEVEEDGAPYIYAPKSEAATGVGKGANLTSSCSGELTSLCSDTSYAGQRVAEKRPTSGSWDIGAYEW